MNETLTAIAAHPFAFIGLITGVCCVIFSIGAAFDRVYIKKTQWVKDSSSAQSKVH